MVYPDPLKQRGLAPSVSFSTSIPSGSHNWNRLWIVVKEIKMSTHNEGDRTYIDIGDIKMKVEARQMEQDHEGKLKDKVI